MSPLPTCKTGALNGRPEANIFDLAGKLLSHTPQNRKRVVILSEQYVDAYVNDPLSYPTDLLINQPQRFGSCR